MLVLYVMFFNFATRLPVITPQYLKPLSVGAIVGIVIGSVVGIDALCICLWFTWTSILTCCAAGTSHLNERLAGLKEERSGCTIQSCLISLLEEERLILKYAPVSTRQKYGTHI